MASGSWTGQYRDWLGVGLPVHVVKGQILATRILPSPISTTVWHRISYLLPKADGSIVMGTTREEVNFDDGTTLRGGSRIPSNAIDLVPAVARAELHKVWAWPASFLSRRGSNTGPGREMKWGFTSDGAL